MTSNANNSYQPGVYKLQGGKVMVVDTSGTIEIAGTLQVDSGATIVGYLPLPPSGDGVYQLTISSGVASWTAAS